jgi:hypothetical protein
MSEDDSPDAGAGQRGLAAPGGHPEILLNPPFYRLRVSGIAPLVVSLSNHSGAFRDGLQWGRRLDMVLNLSI